MNSPYMTIEELVSSKNKKMLLINDFIYHFNRQLKNGNAWRCVHRSCAGKVTTDINNKHVLKETKHDHIPDEDRLIKNKIITFKNSSLTKNVQCGEYMTDITVKIRNEGKQLPCITNMRDVYTRELKKINAPITTDTDILQIYKKTLANENFLHFDTGVDNIHRILFYTTKQNLEYLSMSTCWLSDGTFYSSPANYYQIYIVYGFYFSKIFPLLYCFCKDKSKQTYIQISNFLRLNCISEPRYWITDFEETPIIAFSADYKQTTFSGCNFHFNQIIIKYLNTTGKILKYRNNTIFRSFVNKLMSLSFCPEYSIQSAFNTLNSTDEDESAILMWFSRNFLSSHSCVKQKCFWSVYARLLNDIPSTTNSCEGSNRHLNSYILSKNQHFGVIINAIKKEENRIACMISNLKAGRIKAVGYTSNRIKNIALNYESYTLVEYISYVADTIKVKFN